MPLRAGDQLIAPCGIPLCQRPKMLTQRAAVTFKRHADG